MTAELTPAQAAILRVLAAKVGAMEAIDINYALPEWQGTAITARLRALETRGLVEHRQEWVKTKYTDRLRNKIVTQWAITDAGRKAAA